MPRPTPQIIGQKFGHLIVIKKVSEKGHTKYLCQCDCGNSIEVFASNLISGHTKSCGCIKRNQPAHNFSNLTGQKFGRLYVQGVDHRCSGTVYYKCLCDCGNTAVILGSSLKRGATQSCGCTRFQTISEKVRTHGESNTRLFRIWTGVKNRCYNVNEPSYKNYGSRGISVCAAWLNSYEVFRDWALANGYDENAPYGECTLDRIDVNGDYCPENCRWVNLKIQANNKTTNHFIDYRGERHTIAEWSALLSVPKYIIHAGLRAGKPFAEIVEGHHTTRHLITFRGETLPMRTWERRMGLGCKTLYHRIKKGWSIEDALLTPAGQKRKEAPEDGQK